MAIVTIDYYNSTYYGEPVAAADFPRYDARAEAIIGQLTRGRYASFLAELTEKGLTTAAEQLTQNYKSAICAQIEYYQLNGIATASGGLADSSYTIGKISVSSGGGNSDNTGVYTMVCPAARMYLEQTGLLYGAVPVVSDTGRGWWY